MQKYFSLLLLSCVFIYSCNLKNKDVINPYYKMQCEAMNFIAQPTFSGDYIFYKVTTAKANLEMYYIDTKVAYFTCNKSDFNAENLNKFVINRDSLTIAKQEKGTLKLDSKRYYDTSKVFFKMNVSNFKIDSNKIIETKYNDLSYKITLSQILNFTYLKSALGGGAIAISNDGTHFMNHGSVVAKKGEPSLSLFVNEIIKDETKDENKAQQLLNFVTKQIDYNTKEATNGYETIKRPNEVLLTKNSDCSGKAILYASLLQQTNLKWCLLYFENHICVGVSGNFNAKNPLKFKLNNTDYYMAEITDQNAIIGYDSWQGQMNTENLKYYQTSENGSTVYDNKTKKELDFVRGKLVEN